MQASPIRRLITGVDHRGQSTLIADAPCPHVRTSEHRPGVVYHNLWTTDRTPAAIEGAVDPVSEAMALPPPAGGSNFRIVEFAPERDYPAEAGDAVRGFAELGRAPDALVAPAASRHPGMHRTRSVDYVIVLEGEIWLVLDDGETLMRQGDVCIQRGTNHAWSNRSVGKCTMAFVLIDGT
jgi:hypothetical protein